MRNTAPLFMLRMLLLPSLLCAVPYLARAADEQAPRTQPGQLAAAPIDDANLFDTALKVAQAFDPETDAAACRKAYEDLLARCRADLAPLRKGGKPLDPRKTVAVLNKRLLLDLRTTYIENQYWRDSIFTAALMHRRGNCLATSLLYWLIARDLELPVGMAYAPAHCFVRWDDGTTVLNIETTDRGRLFTDATLRHSYNLKQEDQAPNGYGVTLTEDQARAQLYTNWSAVFLMLNRRKEAFAWQLRAEALDGKQPYIRLNGAYLRFADGKRVEAEAIMRAVYTQATSAWTKEQAALAWAQLLEGTGRVDEAITLLNKHESTARGDNRLRVIWNLGLLHRHNRDFKTALAYHRKHVSLDPCEVSYASLGAVYAEAGEVRPAIAAYERAITYNKENVIHQVYLAGLYIRDGRADRGRALFAKLEEPRADKLVWHCALAWYYAVTGDEAKMLAGMEAAMKLDETGETWHYFVREPDLDAHRNRPAFKALMAKYKRP